MWRENYPPTVKRKRRKPPQGPGAYIININPHSLTPSGERRPLCASYLTNTHREAYTRVYTSLPTHTGRHIPGCNLSYHTPREVYPAYTPLLHTQEGIPGIYTTVVHPGRYTRHIHHPMYTQGGIPGIYTTLRYTLGIGLPRAS